MGKKNTPFAPYQGTDDYIFVSYAHKDSAKVFEIIALLHGEKYRVWYDEGIDAGTEWPQVVAESLLRSSLVLIFISENALRSQNCRREIHYAVSQKKNMVVVMLDSSELPPDLGMQLSVVPRVEYRDAVSAKEGIKKYLDRSLIGDGITGYETSDKRVRIRKNIWLYIAIAAIVVCVLMAVYIFAGLSGRVSGIGIVQKIVEAEAGNVSVTEFNDQLSMKLLLNTVDSKYIHICGNSIVSDPSAIKLLGGEWYVAGEQAGKGIIGSLDPFKSKGLEQLSLVNEKLKDLKGIEELKTLTYLDISGNPLTDLSGIEKLDSLETLYILDIPAEIDLSVLSALKNLKRVYISYDMRDDIGSLVDKGIDVTITGTH